MFKASPAHTWRYILYDTDACLGHFGQSVWENYLEYARNPSSPSVHSNLFDHVLDNPTFRHRFVNRYADLVNTLLQSEAFIARMGAMTGQIEGTMPQHIARWGAPAGMDAWDNALNNMMLRESERVTTSRIHLIESFNLPFQRTVTLNATPNWAGDIRVNTIVPGPTPGTGCISIPAPLKWRRLPTLATCSPTGATTTIRRMGSSTPSTKPSKSTCRPTTPSGPISRLARRTPP